LVGERGGDFSVIQNIKKVHGGKGGEACGRLKQTEEKETKR